MAKNKDGFEAGADLNFDDLLNLRAKGKQAPASSIPESPEDIAGMAKAEVRELLEAHGVEVEKGATVSKMRDMLVEVMFV